MRRDLRLAQREGEATLEPTHRGLVPGTRGLHTQHDVGGAVGVERLGAHPQAAVLFVRVVGVGLGRTSRRTDALGEVAQPLVQRRREQAVTSSLRTVAQEVAGGGVGVENAPVHGQQDDASFGVGVQQALGEGVRFPVAQHRMSSLRLGLRRMDDHARLPSASALPEKAPRCSVCPGVGTLRSLRRFRDDGHRSCR